MAAPIRYLVPYQIDVKARDILTHKKVENTYYMKNGLQAVSPPAYGAPIPGPSDINTLLASFVTVYEAEILPLLSTKTEMVEYRAQSILGKQYTSSLLTISGMSLGTPVSLTTSGPHNLTTGNMVSIAGVTSPAFVNGNWQVTVTSPVSFTLDGSSLTGTWSGNGSVQLVTGRLAFTYGDQVIIGSAATGSIAGDALPQYCSVSMRRIAVATGRHFRSRVGLGIIGEASQVDGVMTNAWLTLAVAAATAFNVGYSNGGSDASSGLSRHYVLSRELAMSQASPFAASSPFTSEVNNFGYRANMGSQVSRKVKLS